MGNAEAMVYSEPNLCFPGGSEVKESACQPGDTGSNPGSGRFPGEGNGNPLQYSCLGNPMERHAWQATVHGVAKSHMTEKLSKGGLGEICAMHATGQITSFISL